VSAYRLASVTKPMTAIGILHLAEEGLLDLDAEVQTYVPYFPRKQWPVHVRQLLGHLGGISHYRNYDLEGHFKEHKDTRQAIAVFEDFDLVAEPGTQYNYSSYGYNLLGAVIEGAAGEPYGEFMQRILWEPLGMEDTRMDDPYVIIPNRVRGYRPGPNGEVVPSEFVDISSRFAAGGTRSTVVDLLRLAEGLRDGRVLSPHTLDLMWTPMTTRDGRNTRYAMGWRVRPVNGRFAVGHTGGQAETRTFFMYVPSEQMAIAAAVNYEGGGWLPYVQRLYQLLMDEGYNQAVYAAEDYEQRVYDVFAAVFDSGVPHYQRHRQPFATSATDIDRAFVYLEDVLDRTARGDDPDSIATRITDGRHPISGSPFPIAGSYMAAVVEQAKGAGALDALHQGGAIELFAAYVEAYRDMQDVPATRRLSTDLERIALAMREDWRRAWTNDSRQLVWPTYDGLETIEPLLDKLERRFADARRGLGARALPPFGCRPHRRGDRAPRCGERRTGARARRPVAGARRSGQRARLEPARLRAARRWRLAGGAGPPGVGA
jgi:CubicO group peptidase (beta-lactamase class C family)